MVQCSQVANSAAHQSEDQSDSLTNEEMQKAMEFIPEQQAQSSAKIDALAVAQDRSEKKWERTEEGIRALLSCAQERERNRGL